MDLLLFVSTPSDYIILGSAAYASIEYSLQLVNMDLCHDTKHLPGLPILQDQDNTHRLYAIAKPLHIPTCHR